VNYDFGDSVVVFLFWFLAGLALALDYLLKQTPSSARAAARRHMRNGLEKNLEIQPQ